MLIPKNETDILKQGTVFEKYTIEKFLGRGGMGAVYLARHNILDSLFAIKILSPDVASKSRQFVDRFIREAKLACKIKHPNLIAVHDAGKNSENGIYYIVMDYVPGGSVRDLLKQESQITPEHAIRITSQIAAALEAAYHFGMVHRDVKPENIMFSADGTAKLADLGIAKSTDEQDTVLTIAASVFGTPAYMSPEQAMDSSKVDTRADIYSLGIVFFEMLAGQLPYSGKGTIQILSQVVTGEEIPDIRTFVPSVSPEIAALISAMTEKKVEKRIQTPTELRKRLYEILRLESGRVYPLSSGQKLKQEHSLPHFSSEPSSISYSDGESVSGKAQAEENLSSGLETMPTLVKQKNASPQSSTACNAIPEKGMPHSAILENSKEVSGSAANLPSSDPHPDTDSPLQENDAPNAEQDSTIPTIVKKQSESFTSTIQKENDGELLNEETEKTLVRSLAAVSPEKEKTPRLSTVSVSGTIPGNRKRKQHHLRIAFLAAVALLGLLILSVLLIRMTTKQPSPVHGVYQKSSSGGNKMPEVPGPVVSHQDPSTGNRLPSSRTSSVPSLISGPSENESDSPSMTSDLLSKNQIILLGSSSGYLRTIKNFLIRTFGKQHVAFQSAAGMGEYKNKLREIIQTSPAFLILDLSARYADDQISKSGFENIIRYHADILRDNEIPFCFILSANSGNNTRIRFFNETTAELCKLRSIPVILEGTPSDKLLSLVREMKTEL